MSGCDYGRSLIELARATGVLLPASADTPPQQDSSNTEAVDPAVALARSVGMFIRSGPQQQQHKRPDTDPGVASLVSLARSVGVLPPQPGAELSVASATGERTGDILSLGRALGVIESASPESRSPEIATAAPPCSALIHPNVARQPMGSAATGSAQVSAASAVAKSRMSKQEYLVLDIAPGGTAALFSLETKLGLPFAAEARGRSYWYEAKTNEGGQQRAFSFMPGQRHDLQQALARVSSPTLRLSIQSIDRSRFALAGPALDMDGTFLRSRQIQIPQLPPALGAKLRTVERSA